jgi:hypothetical protein
MVNQPCWVWVCNFPWPSCSCSRRRSQLAPCRASQAQQYTTVPLCQWVDRGPARKLPIWQQEAGPMQMLPCRCCRHSPARQGSSHPPQCHLQPPPKVCRRASVQPTAVMTLLLWRLATTSPDLAHLGGVGESRACRNGRRGSTAVLPQNRCPLCCPLPPAPLPP